jgi:hypothetical protein
MRSVTEEDIRAVAEALVLRAKSGDVPAVRELLDRVIGKGDEPGRDPVVPIINVVTGVPDRDDGEDD